MYDDDDDDPHEARGGEKPEHHMKSVRKHLFSHIALPSYDDRLDMSEKGRRSYKTLGGETKHEGDE